MSSERLDVREWRRILRKQFFFSFRPLIFASYNDMVSDLLNGGSSKKYARSLCGGFFVFVDFEHDFRQKKGEQLGWKTSTEAKSDK